MGRMDLASSREDGVNPLNETQSPVARLATVTKATSVFVFLVIFRIRSSRRKSEEQDDVCSHVSEDFAVLAERLPPRIVFAALRLLSAKNVESVNQRVMRSCAPGIHLKPFIKCGQSPLDSHSRVAPRGLVEVTLTVG